MARPDQTGACAISEKIFRRLLFLYPKGYRDEFGPSMGQLFRDQCRDAWEERRSQGLLKLWLRVLPDLLRTSAWEHVTALKEKSMNERIANLFRSHTAPRKAFLTVFLAVFLSVFGATALVTFVLPDGFSSTARVRLESYSAELKPGDLNSVVVYDPYFIQTEFEVIQSDVVLRGAAECLNLNVLWGKKYNGGVPIRTREALELLRKSLELRPIRNTSLIEIRVYRDQPHEAADLANAIAEAYRAHRLAQTFVVMSNGIAALRVQWNEQEQKEKAARDRVDELRKELRVPDPEPAEKELAAAYPLYTEAKKELAGLVQLGLALRMKIASGIADIKLPRHSWVEITDRAVPNFNPVRPRKILNLFVGAIAGVILGLIAGGTSGGMTLLIGKKLRAHPAVQT